MCDLTSGVFEHLDITSTMDVDQMVAYTQRIIIGAALKTYKAVLIECNHSVKDLAGDTWDLSALKELFTENFRAWDKKVGTFYDRGAYLLLDKCVEFENELWF